MKVNWPRLAVKVVEALQVGPAIVLGLDGERLGEGVEPVDVSEGHTVLPALGVKEAKAFFWENRTALGRPRRAVWAIRDGRGKVEMGVAKIVSVVVAERYYQKVGNGEA